MLRSLAPLGGFALLAVLGCTRPEVLPPDAGLDAPALDAPMEATDAALPPDALADAPRDVSADAPVGECAVDEDCDDGDVCNGNERCDDSARCVPGTALVCEEDANPCTTVSCSPTDGCVAIPVDPSTVCFEDRATCRRSLCTPTGTCPMPTSICAAPTPACCGDNTCVGTMTAC